MVRNFLVIRIRAALQQQARHLRMMSHACRAVERTLLRRMRLVLWTVKAGVGICAGIEKRRGGAHKTFRSRRIEAQIFREAEIRQWIPTARTASGGGARRICRNEFADSRIVAEHCSDIDVAAGNFGMGLQNLSRSVQRSVP